MAAPRPWVWRGLQIVTGLTLALLIAQYLLGLWTNVYAPSKFTSNTAFPSLNAHYLVGDVLFLLSIVVLIFAALSRQARFIVPAVVLLVAIYLAGSFGMAFVSSTPNDPIDSFLMGLMFLIALLSALNLAYMAGRRGWVTAPLPPATVPA